MGKACMLVLGALMDTEKSDHRMQGQSTSFQRLSIYSNVQMPRSQGDKDFLSYITQLSTT